MGYSSPRKRLHVLLCCSMIILSSFDSKATCSAFLIPTSTFQNVPGHSSSLPSSMRKSPKQITRTTHLSMVANESFTIIQSLANTLAACSTPATAFAKLTDIGAHTPPAVYFLTLVLAGFGIPMSEDVLCVFCGTLLPTINQASRVRLVFALYAGVFFSDLITFSIGRMMRLGLLDPVRRWINLSSSSSGSDSESSSQEQQPASSLTTQQKLRKRDRVRLKLEQAGDYVGFATRLSFGIRPGLMLLAGFSGKVSFGKYALGTALGAIVSLTLQLITGYSMTSPNIFKLDVLSLFRASAVPVGIVGLACLGQQILREPARLV